MGKMPIWLAEPPTEMEVAGLLMTMPDLSPYSKIVRRMAFQLDRFKEEVARLKRGDFTPEELQDICHNLSERPEDYEAFCDGCTAYQRKLFGKSREDKVRKLGTDQEQAVTEKERT